MRVTMLLADHATAAEGKLYISGGGWSVTGPTPMPSAIALLLQVPWDRANMRHVLRIDLVDADGQPVAFADEDGELVPVQLFTEFEVGRPPGMTPGVPIDMPMAFNLSPLPLPPGQRFQWNLSIDDETREDWYLAFSTRATD